jgi:hypothetical protein
MNLMETIQQVLNSIIRNVLTALYQPFWAALLLAGVSMFAFLYAKEHDWKNNNFLPQMIRVWYNEFRSSSAFRRTFLLVFYTTMILFRTVLNRQIWFDPLGKIMGGWGLYDADGTLTTESIENFMLFVPFTILLFWAFREQLFRKELYLRTVIWKSLKVVGTFALTIEFVQVLFHLGTFQLSDLFYNTLGGMCGGMIYYSFYKIKTFDET